MCREEGYNPSTGKPDSANHSVLDANKQTTSSI